MASGVEPWNMPRPLVHPVDRAFVFGPSGRCVLHSSLPLIWRIVVLVVARPMMEAFAACRALKDTFVGKGVFLEVGGPRICASFWLV